MNENNNPPVTPINAFSLRQVTNQSIISDNPVPIEDPKNTVDLLLERLYAWKHVVDTIEDYMGSTEKIQKAQAKEYERVLKTIHHPLKVGHHFDQNVGGIAGLFENMRQNTEALIRTHTETEKKIKESVLPVIEILRKEIRSTSKEISSGPGKDLKDVEKARNTTQKHIELLGQNAAGFDASGGRINSHEDPYVLRRGIIYRLSKQLAEENCQRQALVNLQEKCSQFEHHIIEVIQTSLASLVHITDVQVRSQQEHYSDMLKTAQAIPTNFEWNGFVSRFSDKLIDPNGSDRSIDHVKFPNQDHRATVPVIEGTLERKSRNKLSFAGFTSGYYVVTLSRFLHEFRDNDNIHRDPVPELSIYLPDANVSNPKEDKFNIKGKDISGGLSSKLSGHSEFQFKASSAEEAQNWLKALLSASGNLDAASCGPSEPSIEGVVTTSILPSYNEADTVAAPEKTVEITTDSEEQTALDTATEEPQTQETVTEEPKTQEKATEEPQTQEKATEEPQTQETDHDHSSKKVKNRLKRLSSKRVNGKFFEKLG